MTSNQLLQSPHWADQITAKILKWKQQNKFKLLHVDDMKTPSGRVHTGALRGVLLHDIIAKVLKTKGEVVNSTYVFNDMDPMDSLPTYLNSNQYQQHLGKPLYKVPAPKIDESGIDFSKSSQEEIKPYLNAKNFAEFYALDFIEAFRELNCDQKIIWSHELYESGQMDNAIRISLDNTPTIKKIYQQIADYNLPSNWYPFQVFCEQCDKVGSTLVTHWDGQLVSYQCQKKQVDWTTGCGHQGKTSPFCGNGKLLWKVDWPAHWYTMKVNIEGAGKDHSSAGGSRDMAKALCKSIFNIKNPFDIPYEWILIRGT